MEEAWPPGQENKTILPSGDTCALWDSLLHRLGVKATTGGKMLYVEPQVVALITFFTRALCFTRVKNIIHNVTMQGFKSERVDPSILATEHWNSCPV